MYYLDIRENEGGHAFEKMNLVTLSDKKGGYDKMKCNNCGIVGKRRGLSSIEVASNYSQKKVMSCPGYKEREEKKVEVIECRAHGRQFKNLTPGSTHVIVEPPEEHREGLPNGHKGVWVMGVGEPVRLLPSEFKYLTETE